MVCKNTKELLAEIKKYMMLNDIQLKDLAISMGKSHQSVSQIFQNGNPKSSTLFEICDALGIKMDIFFIDDSSPM